MVISKQHTRNARANAICWAKAVLAYPKTVIMDIETTGLAKGERRPVQIAVMSTRGKMLLEALIQPEETIPEPATAIHGIDDGDVALAATFPQVHGVLAGIFQPSVEVVVYNGHYDWEVLEEACEQYQLPMPAVDVACAMRAYAKFHGQWDAKYDHWRWQSLTEACLQMGIGVAGAHSAAVD